MAVVVPMADVEQAIDSVDRELFRVKPAQRAMSTFSRICSNGADVVPAPKSELRNMRYNSVTSKHLVRGSWEPPRKSKRRALTID